MEKFINEMIAISSKKQELMKEILEITKRQREFIKLGKIETVSKQIELKERIINEVNKLDLEFYQIYNELKKSGIEGLDKLDVNKYPQLKELRVIVENILSITNETKVIDDENILRLQNEKKDLSIKLKGLKQGKRASNAYGAQKNMTESVFLDKKK